MDRLNCAHNLIRVLAWVCTGESSLLFSRSFPCPKSLYIAVFSSFSVTFGNGYGRIGWVFCVLFQFAMWSGQRTAWGSFPR